MGADYGSSDPFIYTKTHTNRSQPWYLYHTVRVTNVNNRGSNWGLYTYFIPWHLTVNSFSRLPPLGICGGPEKDRRFVIFG